MILALLLSELTRLGVRLFAEQGNLRVQAPAGVLTGDLRQAMIEHKATLLRFVAFPYVETIDGLGRLTGNRQEQDLTFVAPERQEVWHYQIGVVSLQDGIERFYWPRMVSLAQPDTGQMQEKAKTCPPQSAQEPHQRENTARAISARTNHPHDTPEALAVELGIAPGEPCKRCGCTLRYHSGEYLMCHQCHPRPLCSGGLNDDQWGRLRTLFPRRG